MSTTDLPAPSAARLRTPGWRDPRLLVGVALVAVSVLAGSWLVRSASHTVGVYAAASALVPGTALDASTVRVVQVRGVDTSRYLSADAPLPPGRVLARVVGAGELVPASALAGADQLTLRPVTVTLRAAPSRSLRVGAQVDLWFTPTASASAASVPGAPTQLVAAATVAEVDTSTGALTSEAGSVQVLVPTSSLAAVLAALSGDGVVDVVVVPGSAG